jgi:receptor protein-tyrosine kinase
LEISEYPRMLRRRWVAIVVVTGIMLIFAWLTVPTASQAARERRQDVTYRATHTLLAEPGAKTMLDRWSLLVSTGPIPQSVAAELSATNVTPLNQDPGKQPGGARARTLNIGKIFVRVATDPSASSLGITVIDARRATAEHVADLLASKLRSSVQAEAVAHYDSAQAAAIAAVARSQARADALRVRLLGGGPDTQVAYDNAVQELGAAQRALSGLENQGRPAPLLRTLDNARAERIVTVTGIQAPKGRTTRLLLGGALGLVLGLGLAMVLERLDASVRGVAIAETAAGLPVIAEIPHVRIRKGTRYEILSLTMPKSLFAEAYRGLRTSISLMSMAHATGAHVARQGSTGDDELVIAPEPQVILVASPGPSEGKSTTSANLATTYAGMGSSVVVIDLDFRRQKLHRFFQACPTPHLENTGTRERPTIDFDGLIQPTNVPGVRFLGSAPRNTVPEHALLLARAAIARAREVADIVILDAPPLLLTNDAKDLIPYADALVLLARDGRTHRRGLERTSQLLRRLDAPVVGLGLIESRSSGSYGYYRYGYGYGYGSGSPQRRPPRARLTRDTKSDIDLTAAEEPHDTKRARLRVWPRR